MTPLDRIIGGISHAKPPAKAVTESYDEDSGGGSGKLERHYMQWLKSANSFKPVGDVVLQAALTPAAYQVKFSMEGPYFERVESKTDSLMIFEKSSMQKVVEEIDRFWNKKAAYDALGFGGFMAKRLTFIINPEGKVVRIIDSVKTGDHDAQVLELLRELQNPSAT